MNKKTNNSTFNSLWLLLLLLPLIAGCVWLIYDFNSRPIPDKPNPGYNPKHLSSDQMKAFDPSFGFKRERRLGAINVPQAGTRLPKYTNKLKMLVDADGNRSYPLGHTKNTRRQSISPYPPYFGSPPKNNQQSTPQETQYEYSNGQSFKKQETQVSENHEPKPNSSSKKVWVVKGLGAK